MKITNFIKEDMYKAYLDFKRTQEIKELRWNKLSQCLCGTGVMILLFIMYLIGGTTYPAILQLAIIVAASVTAYAYEQLDKEIIV